VDRGDVVGGGLDPVTAVGMLSPLLPAAAAVKQKPYVVSPLYAAAQSATNNTGGTAVGTAASAATAAGPSERRGASASASASTKQERRMYCFSGGVNDVLITRSDALNVVVDEFGLPAVDTAGGVGGSGGSVAMSVLEAAFLAHPPSVSSAGGAMPSWSAAPHRGLRDAAYLEGPLIAMAAVDDDAGATAHLAVCGGAGFACVYRDVTNRVCALSDAVATSGVVHSHSKSCVSHIWSVTASPISCMVLAMPLTGSLRRGVSA
jgi:hypothetical protein